MMQSYKSVLRLWHGVYGNIGSVLEYGFVVFLTTLHHRHFICYSRYQQSLPGSALLAPPTTY